MSQSDDAKPQDPDDPVDDFRQAVEGVTPLQQRVFHERPQYNGPNENHLRRRAAAVASPQQDPNFLTSEAVEMLDPHDLLSYKRDGVQEGVFRKLRLGKYEIEAVLDLHRQTVKEARESLFQFILDCETLGIRTVMVLHGKGERSDPPAVLKSYTAKWLEDLPQVMAFHSAQRHHGGAGALYVLVRKSERKKQENRERHLKGRVPYR